MALSTPGSVDIAQAWARAGRKLRKAVPRGDRDRFDALVLDLLAPAQPRPLLVPDPAPSAAERERELAELRLQIGVSTAGAVAKECADPEILAAVVALPWYDGPVQRNRAWLVAERRPLDWATAMVLAMVPVELRTLPQAGDPTPVVLPGPPPVPPHLRQLAALPPLLRGVVMLERSLAGAASAARGPALPVAQPLDDAELAFLASDVPPRLLPPGGRPPSPPAPAPDPVGSAAEAIALVQARPNPYKFGAHTMWVEGAPHIGFAVDARELVYRVRWDAPSEAIRPLGPPVAEPGGRPGPQPREPGWIVDRVTRHVEAVDLAGAPLESYVSSRRTYPLPPGWRFTDRQPIPEGLFDTAPKTVYTVAWHVLREATERYTALLATDTWPDFLVAWRVALHTQQLLGAAGIGDTDSVTAALLAAQGTAPTDTLVDEGSALWSTMPGQWATIVRPDPDETDGPGAARRVERLAGQAAPVRALVVANAYGRLAGERELFGVAPRARREELAALTPLAADLPALRSALDYFDN